jgi:hypothetical protein
MMGSARGIVVVFSAVVLLCVVCPAAVAVPPAVGTQAGRPVSAAASAGKDGLASTLCEVAGGVVAGPVGGGLIPWVGELGGVNPGVCEAAGKVAGGLASEAVSAVGNSVLDGVSTWIIGAATQITGFVAAEMTKTTTPQLQSAWYEAQFQPMADLGAALGLLVALIALASAAVRRSPEALAATLAGIVRAGVGTGLVIPLTVIGLDIADQVSSAVVSASPHTFWATVAHAWGAKGFGGFGSSALAAIIALVEVFAAIFVWIELIVRNAAIYVAVLFFAAALAAAIWPVLSAWPGRLGRLLLLFVVLKPVALIVLSLAGSAAAAGLSFGGGVSGSVGTILAAVVIFALAAFAPWTLMYLLAADAESAYMAAGLRTAAGAAVADEDGRSVRSLGGLRNLGGGGSPGGPGGGPGGGTPGGGGPGGGGGDPFGGGLPGDLGGAAGDFGAAGEFGVGAAGALPIAGDAIGGGSIGAAAGAGALAASTDAGGGGAPGVGSMSQGGSAAMDAEVAGGGGGESSGGLPGGDLPGGGLSGGGSPGGGAPGGGAGSAQAESNGQVFSADAAAPAGGGSSGQSAGLPAGDLSRPGAAGSLSRGGESGPAPRPSPGRGGTPGRPTLTLVSPPPRAADGPEDGEQEE